MLQPMIEWLYKVFVVIFGNPKVPAIETLMEQTHETDTKKYEYQELLLFLQGTIDNLPEMVLTAGSFSALNYKSVTTKFLTTGLMISNLEAIIRKLRTVLIHPNDVTAEIPAFVAVSTMQEQASTLASILYVNGDYISLQDLLILIKKRTGEVITLYTQMRELETIDEDFLNWFDRVTIPTVRETIRFIEELNALGAQDVYRY